MFPASNEELCSMILQLFLFKKQMSCKGIFKLKLKRCLNIVCNVLLNNERLVWLI